MAKLGIGVLGVGEMGRRHAENLRRLVPDARLVAVADVDADRARRAADEPSGDRGLLRAACKPCWSAGASTPSSLPHLTNFMPGRYRR